jgi:glycosyltransferase involved in cell wall biosynthesis
VKKKVLYVLHNHPDLFPGGAEVYALELYETMVSSDEFEPLLVARMGPGPSPQRAGRPGTPFLGMPADPNQHFVFTDPGNFDFFKMTSSDKTLYSRHFADFLRAHDPDIVHFQHTLFIGYDLVSQVRRQLPDVPIVYTLHEYIPICHRDGQMLRRTGELCTHATPIRCNDCFPDIEPARFYLRERLIKSHLEHVDLFLAPSRFLLERYVDWGIPRDKIRFEDYGRLPVDLPEREAQTRPGARNRLGFFGQINRYKGVALLLQAMRRLDKEGIAAHLRLHGANLDLQPEDFRREFADLLEATTGDLDSVTYLGPYDRAELPSLMDEIDWVVVPSLWWENSPLVIQEAFLHGRPVICADVGGMAEKVEPGVDGLHFRAHDPLSLAETIREAVTSEGLWERLRQGRPNVYGMDEHVASLSRSYRALLEGRGKNVLPEPEQESKPEPELAT